ncbi:hypothetical protein D3C72_2570910 [compost metagenome]
MAGLGEALLEVDMRDIGQKALDLVLLPLLQELLAIVVAPADPGLQMGLVMAQPPLEQ